MTVISSKEFATNQEKYFNIVLNEQAVYIENGENMFRVSIANDRKNIYKQPDEDLRRAITMDELREMVKEDIHQWYKERNESISITGSTAVS
jgi:hypothetical protein